jgi:hopene-associated glycosyltransferase HpnB
VYGIAAIALLIWIYLLTGRGAFWRVAAASSPPRPAGRGASVVVVIPARDEAEVIGAAVASLTRQCFAGVINLIVVDDGSSDGTAEAAAAAARANDALPRLQLVRGSAPPRGWTGKLWALAQGVAAAPAADYFLFTDADIQHGPHSVATLVATAEAQGRDLVSHMVRLSTVSVAERLLIPAFVFFFLKLYPPAWIAAPREKHKLAAAAGGCILIRPAALERSGGLEAIRSCIIDDCALARSVKDSGGRITLELTRDTRSLRIYRSSAEIGSMISRSAFAQLNHSYLALGATLLGMFCTYLLPATLLFTADPVLLVIGAAALVLMSACYLPMVRFYGLSPLWSMCLPAIALFYMGAVIHSAVQYARGSGGRWKGRVQDA